VSGPWEALLLLHTPQCSPCPAHGPGPRFSTSCPSAPGFPSDPRIPCCPGPQEAASPHCTLPTCNATITPKGRFHPLPPTPQIHPREAFTVSRLSETPVLWHHTLKYSTWGHFIPSNTVMPLFFIPQS